MTDRLTAMCFTLLCRYSTACGAHKFNRAMFLAWAHRQCLPRSTPDSAIDAAFAQAVADQVIERCDDGSDALFRLYRPSVQTVSA